jgi:hypothetical protein
VTSTNAICSFQVCRKRLFIAFFASVTVALLSRRVLSLFIHPLFVAALHPQAGLAIAI